MADDCCPFYCVDVGSIQSRELGGGPSSTYQVPWCDHPKHSPVSRRDTRRIGGAGLLACGGALGRCPLMPRKYFDR